MDLTLEWWGHSPTLGWVFFDRRLEKVEGALLLYSFRNSCYLHVTRDQLKAPDFVYAPKYLASLSSVMLADAIEKVYSYKEAIDGIANEYEELIDQELAHVILRKAAREAKAAAEKIKLAIELAAAKLRRMRDSASSEVVDLATKYSLVDDDLLDFEDCPTWVFRVLEKLLSGDSFDREELERLRKCEHKYLAAAVHWIAWESTSDPWKAIQSCSLLRRSGNSKKALRLLKSLDPVGWNSRAVSARLTTQGGAQADLELFDESWKSGHAAISAYDTSPHPYMLLGALCYRTDRCAEGDTYFSEAKARGATDREIEYSRLEAERLTSRNTPKK